MSPNQTAPHRRFLLHAAAGVAVAGQLGIGDARAAATTPAATGRRGDFDFLSGTWSIKHRQLKDKQWDTYEGEATVYGILDGAVSVEELRIPARNFSGMGLRVLDAERRLWADHWVNSKTGRMQPASWGSFENGIGTWDTNDVDGSTPIIVRGVWDQITARSCRWFQAVSRDGGKTWQENWVMHWSRT